MNRTYLVGRSPEADIKIASKHDSVGKLHLEITVLNDQQVYLTDRRSANGSSVRTGSGWKQIRGTEMVSADAELKMGDFTTSVRELLAQAEAHGGGGQSREAGGGRERGPGRGSAEPQSIRNYEDRSMKPRGRD